MSDIMDIAEPGVELLADALETVRDGLDSLPDPLRKTVSTVTLIGGAVGIAGPKLFFFRKNDTDFKNLRMVHLLWVLLQKEFLV